MHRPSSSTDANGVGLIKDVDTAVELREVREALKAASFTIDGLRRYQRRDGHWLSTLEVRFASAEQLEQAIGLGVSIGPVLHRVERKERRSAVLQCYNCQGFGHHSRRCRLPPRCVHCAGEHSSRECKERDSAKCASCGEDHKAWDRKCPVYLAEAAKPASAGTTKAAVSSAARQRGKSYADVASASKPGDLQELQARADRLSSALFATFEYLGKNRKYKAIRDLGSTVTVQDLPEEQQEAFLATLLRAQQAQRSQPSAGGSSGSAGKGLGPKTRAQKQAPAEASKQQRRGKAGQRKSVAVSLPPGSGQGGAACHSGSESEDGDSSSSFEAVPRVGTSSERGSQAQSIGADVDDAVLRSTDPTGTVDQEATGSQSSEEQDNDIADARMLIDG